MIKKLFFIATLLYIGATVSAENYLVKSPDGKIVAELNTNKPLSLQFKYNGSILLQESSIGVTLNDGTDMGKNPKVASHKLSNHKETIHAPFYRQQNFETAYQELNLKLKNGFGIILRAYDEGVAYRFYTQRKGNRRLPVRQGQEGMVAIYNDTRKAFCHGIPEYLSRDSARYR